MYKVALSRLRPDRHTIFSLLSGILLSAPFSRFETASLAWISLAPLFYSMRERPFRSGFLSGFAYFSMVLYWLNIVMTTYGKMHIFFSLAAYLFLVAYLALYFAAATWAACRIEEKVSISPIVTLPVLWVALEFVRSFLLTGFPWASLGYSQQNHLSLIQSADIFGVYGVGFLIVLVNIVLAEAWRSVRIGGRGEFPKRAVALALLLFVSNLAYGNWRLSEDLETRTDSLRVSLVQGNIDQAQKWDPELQEETVDIYVANSRKAALKGGTDLIVWPESATPFYFQEGGPLSARVAEVPQKTGAYLLFGSPAYELYNRRYRFLNSAFLLGPKAELLGRSDKVHLVPFGEYVPLHRFLPFIDKLVVGIGDFSPGTISPLSFDGLQIGVLVCYESIFPELSREWVRSGSDVLINVTNDAWFGSSTAPWQHLYMSRFRAIENRVWIARAANTGVSAFVAPSGRITAMTDLFETTYLNGVVGRGARQTFYNWTGDLMPGLCLILSALWLVKTRRRRST